jgi:hypothetical protein
MTKTQSPPSRTATKGVALLHLAGVSAAEVADQCRPPIHRSTVSHAIQGKHHLSNATFIAITELAGADVATQVLAASKEAFKTHRYRNGNPYDKQGRQR